MQFGVAMSSKRVRELPWLLIQRNKEDWRCMLSSQMVEDFGGLRCCCCCPGQLLAHQGAVTQALHKVNMLQDPDPEVFGQLPCTHTAADQSL
jgi:hypothetical protein